MSKPLIQIDDLIRKMTDEEHARYLEIIKDEIPTTDSPTDAD